MQGIGGHPVDQNNPGLIYKCGDTLDEQIKSIEETGAFAAAKERYYAAIAAQTSDSLPDAIDALLKNIKAGEASESMTEKMVKYTQAQNSISLETYDKLKAEEDKKS